MKDPKIPPSPGSASHPTPEALFEAASGEGDATSRFEIERHAAACSECSAELSHIEAFRAPRPMSWSAREAAWRKFAAPGLASPPRRIPAWAFAAAAAVAAAGLAVPVFLRKSASSPREVVRGSSDVMKLVSPTGVVERAPEEFRFRNPSRLPVRVSIFDAGRSFDWTSEPTTSDRVALPPDQRSRLMSGREYFWTVVSPGSPAPVLSFRIRSGDSP